MRRGRALRRKHSCDASLRSFAIRAAPEQAQPWAPHVCPTEIAPKPEASQLTLGPIQFYASSIRTLQHRRIPCSVQHIRLRPVDPHGETERAACRRRQPVRLSAVCRAFALDVEIERAVGVEKKPVTIADRITVDGIGG